MSTAPCVDTELGGSRTYAKSLYQDASSKLDLHSLRCWMIQRLMLDDGLDHTTAERLVDEVIVEGRERRIDESRGFRFRRIRLPADRRHGLLLS